MATTLPGGIGLVLVFGALRRGAVRSLSADPMVLTRHRPFSVVGRGVTGGSTVRSGVGVGQVPVGVTVAVGVGVRVLVAVGVGVRVLVAVGVGVRVAVGVLVGASIATNGRILTTCARSSTVTTNEQPDSMSSNQSHRNRRMLHLHGGRLAILNSDDVTHWQVYLAV